VLTIAWNRVRDRRRSVARWLRVFASDRNGDRRPVAVAEGPSSERALVDDETYRLVRTLVGALPPKYRDPLLVTVFGGQTFEEAGRVLNIPTGTAKWRANEARRLLRVKLTARGYGNPERTQSP
jgi:DNA-directed RNA polymerase specialized sigma24 family protein